MTYVFPFLRIPQPEQKAVDMDTPPNPPSPADEIGHSKLQVKVRKRILHVMKTKFPGLPY